MEPLLIIFSSFRGIEKETQETQEAGNWETWMDDITN